MVVNTAEQRIRTPAGIALSENRAFLLAHCVLLAVVLVGFARSFYLNTWFIHRPLGVPLNIHGTLLTCWFTITVVQAWLINAANRRAHRLMAWVAGFVAVAVIASAAWINTRAAARITSPRDFENLFIWGNYVSLVSFALLVFMAVRMRQRPDAHRRLLLFASIAIIGPAFARFAFWPVLGHNGGLAPAFAVTGLLVAMSIALAYDLAKARRVHRYTLAGIACLLVPIVIGLGLGLSEAGFKLLRAVGVLN